MKLKLMGATGMLAITFNLLMQLLNLRSMYACKVDEIAIENYLLLDTFYLLHI